jgi:hypothetical protein
MRASFMSLPSVEPFEGLAAKLAGELLALMSVKMGDEVFISSVGL